MTHGYPAPQVSAVAVVTPGLLAGNWRVVIALGSCNCVTRIPLPWPALLLLYDRGYCWLDVVLSLDFPFWRGLVTVSTSGIQKVLKILRMDPQKSLDLSNLAILNLPRIYLLLTGINSI